MKARIKAKAAGLALTPSGKEAALDRFYVQLSRDGYTATKLAEDAGVGRAYLTRVLNGHETGARTWLKILPLLSEASLFHAKQCSAWNIHAEIAACWVRRCRARNAHVETIETAFGRVTVLVREGLPPGTVLFEREPTPGPGPLVLTA